jgi:LuxR family maltose regulon positive regulatory protein
MRNWCVTESMSAGQPAQTLGRLLHEAKLSPPGSPSSVVSRAPLIEQARSSNARCVSIVAPAGYGKTAFLKEWAARESRPVAWVSLDRLDDDPATLLELIASAYGRSNDGRDLRDEMRGFGISTLGRAAPRLASAMASSAPGFVLMLDDLHELRSSQSLDVLHVLVSRIPVGSQAVMAGRAEAPFTARLRASSDVLDVSTAELALDTVGARQLFRAADVDLRDAEADLVVQRTGGWPAGLYLASLAAMRGDVPADAVAGGDKYIADYLYRECLIPQSEEIRRFLVRTSILDRLSGPLCDAVLESTGASTVLRHLAAANLFIAPIDRRRRWYRYHDIFREFLIEELHRTEAEIIEKLHFRAADWYEANGSQELALEHLLSTKERDRSVQLVTQLALPTYNDGRLATAQRWLAALGDGSIHRYPPLAVLAGWSAALTGAAAEAERWAAVADAATFSLATVDGSASFDSVRAMLRAVMCAEGPEKMMADATYAVAAEPDWSPWRDTALWLFAEAHLLAGLPERARILLRASSAAAADLGNADSIVVSEAMLATMAMDRGDWREAGDRLDLALDTSHTHRMQDYVMSLLTFAAAGRLAMHRGDRDDAERQIMRAMRGRPSATHALPFLAIQLRIELVKGHLAMDDLGRARHLQREIDDITSKRPALGALLEDVEELGSVIDQSIAARPVGAAPLTPAELRILPYLQTYLTFREIAERLYVSRHTIGSEVSSIYRKLGVSSRSEAVQRATDIGLLGE